MNYSVVIRTVGTAGKKYQRLLESIDKQTIKPSEVIVVLPKGYSLPPEQLGYETFVFSEKGMVAQRIYGGNIAKSEYSLFLDDDLEFGDTFVEEMYKPIKEGLCDVTIPAFLEMLPPKRGLRKIIPMVSLSACPTVFHKKDTYTRILKSGGWSYNNYAGKEVPKYLKAQTAAGTCFFCKTADFSDIHFEDEMWIQDTQYPLWEDQVMFYKMHLSGKQIFCVTGIDFAHLDAGSDNPNRAVEASFASSRNKIIFWYKFIYTKQNNRFNRYLSCLMYSYSVLILLCLSGLQAVFSYSKRSEFIAYYRGLKNGMKYLKETFIKNYEKENFD